MNTGAQSLNIASGSQTRLMPLALAALLGLFVVGFVGFAPMAMAHNAAHDYRHSMAFPCH